jgi:hypothetical protein
MEVDREKSAVRSVNKTDADPIRKDLVEVLCGYSPEVA